MRTVVCVVCMLALALVGGPAAAQAACGQTERFAPRKDAGPGRAPLAIGDSVLLGAADRVARLGYAVDVRICRSTTEGVGVLRRHKRHGRLGRLAVVALGANSDFALREVRRMLRILGPRRTLGLVTPLEVPGLSTRDAATMRRAARRWPARIVLLDWARHAKRRPKLTYSDGIHLTPPGQRAMTRLLRRALPYATGDRPAPTADQPPAGGEEEGGGVEAP